MNLEVFKIWISFQCIYLIGKSADFVLGYIGSLEPEVLCIAKRALSVSLCPDWNHGGVSKSDFKADFART